MTKPAERHDTAEHLLSPEAVERALAGKASEEKAKAFREHLEEHPEAAEALERYRKLGSERNSVAHTGLQRIAAQRAPESGPVAIEPEKPKTSKRALWVALGFLSVMLLAVLVAVLGFKREPEAREETRGASPATEPTTTTTATAVSTTAAVSSIASAPDSTNTAATDPQTADTSSPTPSVKKATSDSPSASAKVTTSAKATDSAPKAPPSASSSGLYFKTEPQ